MLLAHSQRQDLIRLLVDVLPNMSRDPLFRWLTDFKSFPGRSSMARWKVGIVLRSCGQGRKAASSSIREAANSAAMEMHSTPLPGHSSAPFCGRCRWRPPDASAPCLRVLETVARKYGWHHLPPVLVQSSPVLAHRRGSFPAHDRFVCTKGNERRMSHCVTFHPLHFAPRQIFYISGLTKFEADPDPESAIFSVPKIWATLGTTGNMLTQSWIAR